MLIELVFMGLGMGVISGGAYLRSRGANRTKSLPMAGDAPSDRGEAVRRVLKHLQRKTIAELEEGTAGVVEGIARAIPGVPMLRSPVTGVECIGYHLDIRATYLSGGYHFPQLREEARCTALDVADGSGVVRVDPNGLELAITDGPIGRWEPPIPPQIRALLPPHLQAWGLSVTVEEGILMPGAPILVCGVAARELAATDYRDGAAMLMMRASSTFPLVASTDADLFRAGDRPIAPEELRTRR